jgi:dolichol-phosphate mannosyltransferase
MPPDGGPATPRILISLASYNEAGNIADLTREVLHVVPSATVLIIDDNSPDGTGQIADELAAELPGRVEVLHRAGKLGLGTAILAAMRRAVEGGYDFYINLDADFSHPPRYLPALIAGMDHHDVMIGSRYVPGGAIAGELFTLKRRFMSTGINLYARLFLGLRTKDNSGSFRCYRVSKLAAIDLDCVRSRGYSFMEEILYWCRSVGCSMGETPITFENRRSGVTKITAMEAVKALWIIAYLGAHRLVGRTPGPVSRTT